LGVGVFVVVLAAALAGLIVWYSFYRKKKRRLALAGFAAQHRLRYSRQDPFDLIRLGFNLFSLGDGRGCENVVYGDWQGMATREADFWYYTESSNSKGNRNRNYHYFSMVVVDAQAYFPHVTVQKETLGTRLAGHLGFHDIEFESEDFNREFRVKAGHQEFAFQLIDARMIRWMLSTDGRFGFEVNGPNLLVYQRRVSPSELLPLFGTAKAFVDHVPRLVWNEYGTQRDTGEEETEGFERSTP
jgi:hypothetical protein